MKKLELTTTSLDIEEFKSIIDPYTEITIVAPWNGEPVPVTIVMLDSVSLNSCGDFSTIAAQIKEHNETSEITIDDMLATKNIHEKMLKLALVHPTFDELYSHLDSKDFVQQKRAKIKELKEKIELVDSAAEKNQFNKELELLEVALAFLLPEDFTNYIVSILMQQKATDVHKLTKEMLLRIGFLAERSNMRPSEYLQGKFTDKHKEDIDAAAFTLVAEYREQKKIEKDGTRWIGRRG